MAVAVSIKHVTVYVGGNHLALDDVSADIQTGTITGIIGPSGAGKTTLIRAVVGRQAIDDGEVIVLGEPAGSPDLRHTVSYMTQTPSVYPDLTAAENVAYFAAMLGLPRPVRKQAVAGALDAVGLADQGGQVVATLSGGQKQRVSLAIALIGHPKLLVLDEPTVGLDPVLREQLWGLFKRLARAGTTIIVTSHAMDEAERCQSLLLIRGGRLIAHDTPTALMRQTRTTSVEKSFIALVGSGREAKS